MTGAFSALRGQINELEGQLDEEEQVYLAYSSFTNSNTAVGDIEVIAKDEEDANAR